MMNDKRSRKIKSRKFVRHKKKNWRKHCDVTDIEEWLDDKRKQEVSGFKPASERTNEELFQIDQDSSMIDIDQPKPKPTFYSLESEKYAFPDTTVAPILPNPVKQKFKNSSEMETTDEVIDSSDDDEHDMRQAVSSRRSKILATIVRGRKFSFVKKRIQSERLIDLWNNDGTVSHRTFKRPGMSKEQIGSVSLSLPHPGTSYNPEYIDHQRLLKKALAIETEKIAKEDKLNRTLILPKMTAADRESQWQLEMLEGLEVSKNDGDIGEDIDDNRIITKRPIKASNRKTHKQRRKERLSRIMLKRKKLMHIEKVRMDEIYRIRSLKKEIKQVNDKIDYNTLRRHAERTNRDLKRTKRLGKHVYKQAPVVYKLSDEIAGSLRLLQAEGSNTLDRYNGILKRNMAVPKGPRTPTRSRKHKPNERWVISRAYDLRPEQLGTK